MRCKGVLSHFGESHVGLIRISYGESVVVMDEFFIDKLGNVRDGDNDEGGNEAEISGDERDENLDIKYLDLYDESLDILKCGEKKTKRKNNFDINDTYLVNNYKNLSEKIKDSFTNVDQILERSSLKPGLEKESRVPPEKGKKLLKLERKKLSKKTKGKNWFDMPRAELTKEVMTDFKLLKMRSVLDRKHVYKKNDITHVPKYFQMGTVIESPADFYGGRIPKAQRKKTLVDELLADAEFKKYQKKKFKEIMDENRRRSKIKKKDKKDFKSKDNKKHKSKDNAKHKSKVKSKNKNN